MAKSFKIATNEFIKNTLKINPTKTLDAVNAKKCPTYKELKEGTYFQYVDGAKLGIQWRGTVNGEDYTGEYDSDRCLAEIDIEKLNAHDFKIYTDSGLTKTSMSADCMTTAEDISGKTRYEADRLNENFIYPVYNQKGYVKWHEYDDSEIKQKTVIVNLSANKNGAWTTYSKNPDSTLYNAYMSTTHADNGYDLMTISLSTGFTDFTIYIRSYAEAGYDFTIAGQIDSSIPTSNYDTGNSKANTSNNPKGGTDIASYSGVVYTNIDSSKEHIIWVMYKKDGSQSVGDDRGYVLIPKSQNNDYVIKEGGEDGLSMSSITHSVIVSTSSCTLTYSGTIKERWNTGTTNYTLTGKYNNLPSNTVKITQKGETYGYYADSAHTQWISANDFVNNSEWDSSYRYYVPSLYNGSLADFYNNLHKQNGWLNDFGDNSGTTNGRDEYNIDTTNYSSGTSITSWGGETDQNITNGDNEFNSSDIMGETISSAETKNYHMAFSNDMWYSGTTLPATIDNKHDFYWIFLNEDVENYFNTGCSETSYTLRGDAETNISIYNAIYIRRYFKPLHCYGKTSIDRIYKYGTNEYDKGTTTMKWLQGNYPKHFKRVVLNTYMEIYPYSTAYSKETDKLGLNEHVVMLDTIAKSDTYDVSKIVKANKGSMTSYNQSYTTSVPKNANGYNFKPRLIMMSPEQYSAVTEGNYERIVSGQQLSYNEHTSGDSYDWNIKKDNDNVIAKESEDTPYISYDYAFVDGTLCYCTWPREAYHYPYIYTLNYGKHVDGYGVRYVCTGYTSTYHFDSFKDFVENNPYIWEHLSSNPGYTGNMGTTDCVSNALTEVTGSATNVSFTYVDTISEGNFFTPSGYASLSSYTYTVNGSSDSYITSPGTTLKINYSGGTSDETEVVASTGDTINVSNEIDTNKIVTSVEYTAITDYEYAINDDNTVYINTGFANFKGVTYVASDPTKYKIITGGTDEVVRDTYTESDTGEIKLEELKDGSVERTLTVYLADYSSCQFTFSIKSSSSNKESYYENFLKNMSSNKYMISLNGNNNYWISDAWDDSKKYVDFYYYDT